MKKYIGTKVVMAKPMAMEEAQQLLGRELKPATSEKEGYLVEYENGYKSWSPKSVFDEAYKCAETFLDRMNIEYSAEIDKFEKGYVFVESDKFNELPLLTRVLLYAQNMTQKQYCDLLQDRIAIADGSKELILSGFDFGTALKLLEAGAAVRRNGWNGKGMFIVKQIPAHITADIIPGMQSLPQIAKDIILKRDDAHIDYTNQMLIINKDGRADSWVPSSSDCFSKDWEIVIE